MIQIKHPYDYDSIEHYSKVLKKNRRELQAKLLQAMRFGLDEARLVECLKYLWVMMFWVEHDSTIYLGYEPGETPREPIAEVGPFLLIDDIHFLLIDDVNKLLI